MIGKMVCGERMEGIAADCGEETGAYRVWGSCWVAEGVCEEGMSREQKEECL